MGEMDFFYDRGILIILRWNTQNLPTATLRGNVLTQHPQAAPGRTRGSGPSYEAEEVPEWSGEASVHVQVAERG